MKTIFAHFLRRIAERLDPVDWAEIERQACEALDAFNQTHQERIKSSSGGRNG